MRHAVRLLGFIVCALLSGCDALSEAAPANVCEAAQHMFQGCGASVPLLTDGACSGLRRSTAICVVDYTHDCDDVAALAYRPDICFIGIVGTPEGRPSDTAPGSELFPGGQPTMPLEESGAACLDGEDNDRDGQTDCDDSACAVTCGPEDNATTCLDGIDNDADGAWDCDDVDCAHLCQPEGDRVSCNDGRDNDLDGLMDCADPACLQPEANSGCTR